MALAIDMNIRPLLIVVILTGFHAVAHAELFKCKGANDRYTFQDVPCTSNAPSQDRKRPKPGDKDENFLQRKNDARPSAISAARPTAPSGQLSTSPMEAPPLASANTAAAATPTGQSWQEKEQDFQKRQIEQADARAKAHNDQAQANSKVIRCSSARQQLGVITDGRPAYTVDNKGDRRYVEDQERAAKSSAAEQRVGEACR